MAAPPSLPPLHPWELFLPLCSFVGVACVSLLPLSVCLQACTARHPSVQPVCQNQFTRTSLSEPVYKNQFIWINLSESIQVVFGLIWKQCFIFCFCLEDKFHFNFFIIILCFLICKMLCIDWTPSKLLYIDWLKWCSCALLWLVDIV